MLYRRYHRLLESAQLRFKFGAAPFSDAATKDMLLAEHLAEVQTKLHLEWEGLVPASTDVHAAATPTKETP